ncbi:MAG: helix-turn-helix domain-containing protein [Monoglobaceae bacterium]
MDKLDKIVVTDISGLFTVTSPKGRFEKIRNRKSYALSFCADGQITYTLEGENTVSDRDHAVILPQGQSYSLHGDKTGVFPVINFTCAEFLCDKIIAFPIRDAEQYIREFEQMKALSLFEENRAEIMSIFYHMLHRLSAQGSSCNTIMPAIKYLEKNFQNPNLTNADLAQQCNISEIYFRRIFTEHYKVTPRQFIIDIRINRAKQLLSDGVLKVCAVAECCGFSNQYHFCRVFKEKTGLTPTEYIRQNRTYKI